MSDEVLVERRGRVLVMTINRPQARNAINGAASRLLCAAIDQLDASEELSVGVITGAGGVFSAGMDLKAFLAKEPVSVPGRGMGGFVETPPAKPLIAAVEGFAVGGGFEMVLACDLVVAGASARFALPEVKRGLIAGGGGALRVGLRLPTALAMELVLTGDAMGAERAAAIGLVNQVVEDGGSLAAALSLADRVAANGPLALAASKEIVLNGSGWSASETWERVREIIAPVFASDDAREGATAFVEKREPVWRNR
jgi:enoyl-CoA hydratase